MKLNGPIHSHSRSTRWCDAIIELECCACLLTAPRMSPCTHCFHLQIIKDLRLTIDSNNGMASWYPNTIW